MTEPFSNAREIAPTSVGSSIRERQLAVLGRLADVGLGLALSLERQVKAAEAAGDAQHPAERSLMDGPPPELDLHQAALSYDRISRAVRLSLMLQDQVLKAIEQSQPPAAEPTEEQARVESVQRIMRRIGIREHRQPRHIDTLIRDHFDRDCFGDIMARPISESIEMICRDLRLDPRWGVLAEEAWARSEIESGAWGRPFAAYVQDNDDDPPDDNRPDRLASPPPPLPT